MDRAATGSDITKEICLNTRASITEGNADD